MNPRRSGLSLALLVVSLAATPATALDLRPDPARPGRVLVGTATGGKGGEVVVVYERPGRRQVYYRSPDARGFEVCVFLRYARLENEKGPLDVKVWLDDEVAPLRLDYDGRSCAEDAPEGAPRPSPGAKKPLAPIAVPTAPPTPTALPAAVGPAPEPGPVLLERLSLEAGGERFAFRARFSRELPVPSRTRVVLSSFFRLDLQKEALERRTAFDARVAGREVRWSVRNEQFRFSPSLRRGERVQVTFEIGGRRFEGRLVTAEGVS